MSEAADHELTREELLEEVRRLRQELEATPKDIRTAIDRLSATADALPALVFHVDSNLVYKFVNKHVEETFKRPREEILGMRVPDLVGPKTYENIRPYLDKALAGERAQWAMWIDFPAGRRYIKASYIPSIDEEGKVVGIDVLAEDHTSTISAQDALRQSEFQYRQIAEGIAPIVWTTLPDGYHDFFSQRWYDYTGMPRDGKRGWEWKEYLHPDDYERTLAVWSNCLQTGEPYEIEYRFKRHDGTYRWYLGQALAIRDEKGEITRWFGTLTDIHDQKEAEALLEQRVAERTADLMRANRDLHAFSYSVAHDLRAPLRAIVSTSRILLEEASDRLTESEIKLLQRQATNARRLGNVVDDMLQFARLSDAELVMSDFDMSAMAENTGREVAERYDRVADLRVQSGMVGKGDLNLVGYAVANLLENAFKYSPEGGLVEVGKKGDAFFVRDHGIGFDMAHSHKLFVAFERLVLQEEFEGTGVGLANVKRIVERHGGNVWAESELGKGSTFWFTLA